MIELEAAIKAARVFVIVRDSGIGISERDIKAAVQHLAHGIKVHPKSAAMYVKRSDLARQTDGKLVAAGRSGAEFWVARFNADGTLGTVARPLQPNGIVLIVLAEVLAEFSMAAFPDDVDHLGIPQRNAPHALFGAGLYK